MSNLNTMLSKILAGFILLFVLFSSGCDKPSPTTLLAPEEPAEGTLEIEVIAKDPTDIFTNSGYDSTGFIPQLPRHNSVIFLGRNVLSSGLATIESSFAQATFFDLNDSVKNSVGRVIGYRTKDVDFVKINLLPLKKSDLVFRFRDSSGNIVHLLAGPKYGLYKRKGVVWGDLFEFVFSSFVNLEIKPRFNPPIRFSVPTPQQITGKVLVSNSPNGKPIINLEWNRSISDNNTVNIILGGVDLSTNTVVPLFSLKTNDDGELILPKELVKGIPKFRFPRIMVSFIRRIDILNDTPLGKLLITTQSSNSIIVDNP